MRQPAGVMARGFWLIELLPALHTEQDLRMADESVGTLAFLLFFFVEDISSILFNVQLRQWKARWKREGKEMRKKAHFPSTFTWPIYHLIFRQTVKSCHVSVIFSLNVLNLKKRNLFTFPANYLIHYNYTKFKVPRQLQSHASKTFSARVTE